MFTAIFTISGSQSEFIETKEAKMLLAPLAENRNSYNNICFGNRSFGTEVASVAEPILQLLKDQLGNALDEKGVRAFGPEIPSSLEELFFYERGPFRGSYTRNFIDEERPYGVESGNKKAANTTPTYNLHSTSASESQIVSPGFVSKR
ncbi:hypothetical protein IFM89_005400 [Coptis chinensis]|uniref:Uncharacterized protein n=1 Tax=Coptis chinensis TaxID=261450 RepID=A0A835M923_9MAGN|nr:hypothetical protein IFM89_005400 [Coptis chinensis]